MQHTKANRVTSILRTFAVLLALLATATTAAFALDLETARAKGLIGEVDNGYIAIPPGAGTEAQALVGSVNQQRREAYAGSSVQ